jgi:hypothetical protein
VLSYRAKGGVGAITTAPASTVPLAYAAAPLARRDSSDLCPGRMPAQPVDPTHALNLSAGVSKLQGLAWPFVELTRRGSVPRQQALGPAGGDELVRRLWPMLHKTARLESRRDRPTISVRDAPSSTCLCRWLFRDPPQGKVLGSQTVRRRTSRYPLLSLPATASERHQAENLIELHKTQLASLPQHDQSRPHCCPKKALGGR